MLNAFWLTHGRLVTPRRIMAGAVQIARGRVAAARVRAPRGASAINLGGAYLAPGFIDLHVWGEPEIVSRAAVRHGTTAFLSALGPEARERSLARLAQRNRHRGLPGAACLGAHLEGPFLNQQRGGALPKRWMRRPSAAELRAIGRVGGVRLMTLAPELPGAIGAIRWCRRNRIVASLGHSLADAAAARRAVDAGAQTVTHVFNGMAPLHHRRPSLLDTALTDDRLTAMVILDGVHVSPEAFRLLVRAKGVERIALVTDSIRHEPCAARARGGAYYTRAGVLAGSQLTMIETVRNAVGLGGVSLAEAVRMASEVPARLLGLRDRGSLEVGKRADLVVFDRDFRVLLTMVAGRIVYQRR